MNAIQKFRELSSEDRFKGWPVVGKPELGLKIPYFGQVLNYKLRTPNGVQDYTSIIRQFGWSMCFGLTTNQEVVTLCQWKPGVNQATWEMPPGGIGKISPTASLEEIKEKTQQTYLKETGLGNGEFTYLGHIMIETGKYRGAGPDDHGLKAHLFLATHLSQIQDARDPALNEVMETILVPLDEFPEVLACGDFAEESAVVCAYKALLALGVLRWTKK